jgi:bifunctional UDP-N-acetylglucosamine pyrophosphorylase/glucosamine-1-phosphate N-acetyltransferase
LKSARDSIALILAAGQGKRMNSDIPKVLHKLNNKYMVDYVIDSARKAGIQRQILIIGHKAEMVKEALANRHVEFVLQAEQLGTGHAIMMAAPLLRDFRGDLVVLCGDMPLVKPRTIERLLAERHKLMAAAVVLTAILEDPAKYGRIVRDTSGLIEAIVEYRDADDNIRGINEVNTGAYCFDWSQLAAVLDQLSDSNDQREYYLTDTVSIFVRDRKPVGAIIADNPNEGCGINSIGELEMVEGLIKRGTDSGV